MAIFININIGTILVYTLGNGSALQVGNNPQVDGSISFQGAGQGAIGGGVQGTGGAVGQIGPSSEIQTPGSPFSGIG
ncbi:hypothetical protein [Effusibacillus consociatus]|uniref:Spore germination protein n=1 Tax=Effusibacillus consociatus TaxID=1117041 RepID=A0ABV9PYB4_9BACL